jgi:hypothetical protein
VPIGARPLDVDVPRPSVNLDPDAELGKGDVDEVWAEGVVGHPSRYPRRVQDPPQQPFGGRVGPVGGSDEQVAGPAEAPGAEVAAVGRVHPAERDVLLQCPVEEDRSIGST